jgi:hypothetical protein
MTLSKRTRCWLLVLGSLIALYTLVGFFVLPLVVKSQLQSRGSAMLGRTVTLEKARVNPFALSVTLEHLDVREKDGKQSFLGWDRLYVNFEALASVTGSWVLGDIELDGFHARVNIDEKGAFNFSDITKALGLDAPAPKNAAVTPSEPGRPLYVKHLAVSKMKLDFSDHSRKTPFVTTIGPATFTLDEFRTAGSLGAPSHFEAFTESGEKVVWDGTVAADPVSSKGHFVLSKIVLKKYSPYFETLVQADLKDGLLSFEGRYEANLDPKQRVIKLLDAHLLVEKIAVTERKTGLVALELPRVEVSGIEADAVAMKATVKSATVSGGHAAVQRAKDGTINLLAMLTPEPAPAPAPVAPALSTPAAPAAASALPQVSLGEFSIADFKVDITDASASPSAKLALNQIRLSVKDLCFADGAKMPLSLSFDWAPKGSVRIEGSFGFKPELGAELDTQVVGFAILPLSSYVEEFLNVRVTQGAVNTANHVSLLMKDGNPALVFSGDVSVDNFALVDARQKERLAGFTKLEIKGIKAATAPELAVSLDEISLAAPYAEVRMKRDGTLNLAGLVKTAAPAAAIPAPVPANTPAVLPNISVGRVVLSDGNFHFTDRSIEPNVNTRINRFGGTVSGISTKNMAKADVALRGFVDDAGPISIMGKVDLLGANRFADIKIDFKNVDLLPLSPYSGKYAGFELAHGKLIVDSKISLQGEKLNTVNVVTLDHFTFGEASHSKDATGLPVRLGVALLKDINGKIVIDLPVQGSLNDPSFKVGKVVMRVIVNLLTKAAVSPFSLIGSMFGGGGDELAFQEFSPGTNVPLASEKSKMDTLVKALNNRPGLSLAIEGSYDVAADTASLKRKRLERTIRLQIWDERHALDPNTLPPEAMEISSEEHAAMLKKLFDAKFSTIGTSGVSSQTAPAEAPAAIAAAPAPTPRKNFFQRLYTRIFRSKVSASQVSVAHNKKSGSSNITAPGAQQTLPVLSLEDMTTRLADTMKVGENELRALANERAQWVRDYFVNTGHVDPNRLFLSGSKAAAKTTGKGPRVEMSLQ